MSELTEGEAMSGQTPQETTYRCRLCGQPRKAKEAYDALLTENGGLREILGEISTMPEHDQDDAHRLRYMALRALHFPKGGGKP